FGPEEVSLDPSQKLLGCRTVAADGTVAVPTLGGNRRPPALTDSSVVAVDQGLWLYGGYRGDQPASELWFLDLSGPPIWRARTTRGTPARVGAQLLPTAAGLLLIGGTLGGEELETEVLRLETRGSRTVWRSLPDLPLPTGLPGAAVVWEDGAIKLLLWADRCRPSLYQLGDVAWERVGEEEAAACRPPAPGEVSVHDGIVTISGPPPLPPCEVILRNGDSPLISFLPALDLPVGGSQQFQLLADGSSQRLFDPGRLPPVWLRPGAPLFPAAERGAPAWRLGVPGRLSWTPYRLRQIHLGRWSEPLAPLAEDEIGLDPRLGRVILPPGAPVRALSRLRASWWEGRPERIGVGCMPADRRLPSCWEDPEVEAWTAPDLAGKPVDGWVQPEEESLPELLERLHEKEAPILAIVGSPSLPPSRISLPAGGLTLLSSDAAGMPRFEQDEGCLSLSFHPSSPDDQPALWLAGLRTVGRLDLHLQRGTIELRWCSLGLPMPGTGATAPGNRLIPAVGDTPTAPAILAGLGLRMVGGGHQDQTALRSLPESTVEIRLHGCQVGAIEIPPWATLVATGCTFDAGDNNLVAIRAAGARVRLRHCTVRGRTDAGMLSASSTLFTGRVRVDQTSTGWLRYCVLPSSGSLPSRFRCRIETVALCGDQPLRPDYLLPSPSNPPELWEAGEAGRCPGAYAERSDRDRELTLRSAEFVPVGTTPLQKDRVPVDLARIRRRPA
ncbi:MAG TPA: kelch repeat-containing protein, partial [Myxococcota bacterium]|nr:kelch repeat-containing protein [Myxococcota bacterium]